MIHTINIFCSKDFVGYLNVNLEKNDAILTYDSEWKERGFELSPHLKFNEEISSDSIKKFISNLLPEGEGLEFISSFFQISKANKFALVEAVGVESAGALTFTNKEEISTSFREIPKDELTKRIKERKNKNITIWDQKPRLSVAGVQDKLPIIVLDDKYGIGEGEMSSTHIFKFDKINEQNLVVNEHFCMSLAKLCGLKVAKTSIEKFEDEKVLIVERFDREIIKDDDTFKIEKKHIIDGCQMLDLDVIMKYQKPYGGANQAEIGASFELLYKSIELCKTKALAKLEVLKWSLFNLIIDNYDAHAKNISFYVDKNGIEVAPFYDLVNIAVYPDIQNEFAFSYGDEFKPENIKSYDLVVFCKSIGINPRLFKQEFQKIIKNIQNNLESLELNISNLLDEEEKKFLHVLVLDIKKNVSKYKNISDEFLTLYEEYKDYA